MTDLRFRRIPNPNANANPKPGIRRNEIQRNGKTVTALVQKRTSREWFLGLGLGLQLGLGLGC